MLFCFSFTEVGKGDEREKKITWFSLSFMYVGQRPSLSLLKARIFFYVST